MITNNYGFFFIPASLFIRICWFYEPRLRNWFCRAWMACSAEDAQIKLSHVAIPCLNLPFRPTIECGTRKLFYLYYILLYYVPNCEYRMTNTEFRAFGRDEHAALFPSAQPLTSTHFLCKKSITEYQVSNTE